LTKITQLWLISLAIILYGFLPYKYPYNPDITSPNNILVGFNECGCPCPDDVIKGYIDIPEDTLKKYKGLNSTMFFLTEESKNDVPFEIQKAYAEVELVKIDTLICGIEGCSYVPVVKINNWSSVQYEARFGGFSKPVVVAYAINFVLFAPILTIIVVIIFIINRIKK
jgi:hypothetical protein